MSELSGHQHGIHRPDDSAGAYPPRNPMEKCGVFCMNKATRSPFDPESGQGASQTQALGPHLGKGYESAVVNDRRPVGIPCGRGLKKFIKGRLGIDEGFGKTLGPILVVGLIHDYLHFVVTASTCSELKALCSLN